MRTNHRKAGRGQMDAPVHRQDRTEIRDSQADDFIVSVSRALQELGLPARYVKPVQSAQLMVAETLGPKSAVLHALQQAQEAIDYLGFDGPLPEWHKPEPATKEATEPGEQPGRQEATEPADGQPAKTDDTPDEES